MSFLPPSQLYELLGPVTNYPMPAAVLQQKEEHLYVITTL